MSKWSKGPWELNTYSNYTGWSIFGVGSGCIAERWYELDCTEEKNAEMKANARLIAAAPELYEALKTKWLREGTEQEPYAVEDDRRNCSSCALSVTKN